MVLGFGGIYKDYNIYRFLKTTFWEKVGPKYNLLKKGWTKIQPNRLLIYNQFNTRTYSEFWPHLFLKGGFLAPPFLKRWFRDSQTPFFSHDNPDTGQLNYPRDWTLRYLTESCDPLQTTPVVVVYTPHISTLVQPRQISFWFH